MLETVSYRSKDLPRGFLSRLMSVYVPEDVLVLIVEPIKPLRNIRGAWILELR